MMTYDDYLVGGGKLTEDDIARSMMRANAVIRRHTFGRLEQAKPPEEAVLLFSALCDRYYKEEQHTGIAAESSDGVSVSFLTAEETDISTVQMIADYLSGVTVNGVPVLYRGV